MHAKNFAMTILVLAGCSEQSTPPAPAAPAAAPATPPVAPAAPPVAAAPSPAPPAEVELAGTVVLPKGKVEAHVFVTDGACWTPAAHQLADVRAGENGSFFAEVMVKQGMLLWVCAALGPPAGPFTTYGALAPAPLKGEGVGEVRYTGLTITLAPGKPVDRPPPRATSPTKF